MTTTDLLPPGADPADHQHGDPNCPCKPWVFTRDEHTLVQHEHREPWTPPEPP